MLKETAIAILLNELHHSQMIAIYLLTSGAQMPESVSKSDLVKIISFLFTKLDWIREETAPSANIVEPKVDNQLSTTPRKVELSSLATRGARKISHSGENDTNEICLNENLNSEMITYQRPHNDQKTYSVIVDLGSVENLSKESIQFVMKP